MDSLFNFTDHRFYLKAFVKDQGTGAKQKLSLGTGISPSLLSQVLTGERNLSAKQAFRFAQYLKFNKSEKEYWLLLNDFGRENPGEFKSYLQARILDMQSVFGANERLRVGLSSTTWSQEFVAVFYSSWHFVVAYCALATKPTWTAQSMAERLLISESRSQQVMDFFLENQIIESTSKSGHYKLTESGFVQIAGIDARTHRAAVSHNNKNMRNKAMEVMEAQQFLKEKDAFNISFVVSLAESDYQEFKKELKKLIDKLHVKIASEKFEKIVCFNADLFKI